LFGKFKKVFILGGVVGGLAFSEVGEAFFLVALGFG